MSVELLRKAQVGDAKAFEELFEPLRRDVFGVACRLVGMNEAEDVVVEAFVKAWQGLPKFSGRSSLRTWLYRITYNCGLDAIRHRSRRREDVLSGEELKGDPWERIPDKTAVDPGEDAAASEFSGRVDRAMDRLPQEHRVTLELRFSEGLSYSEIAAATGVSIGTVMSRLFNARKKLRRLLEEEGNEP